MQCLVFKARCGIGTPTTSSTEARAILVYIFPGGARSFFTVGAAPRQRGEDGFARTTAAGGDLDAVAGSGEAECALQRREVPWGGGEPL